MEGLFMARVLELSEKPCVHTYAKKNPLIESFQVGDSKGNWGATLFT